MLPAAGNEPELVRASGAACAAAGGLATGAGGAAGGGKMPLSLGSSSERYPLPPSDPKSPGSLTRPGLAIAEGEELGAWTGPGGKEGRSGARRM